MKFRFEALYYYSLIKRVSYVRQSFYIFFICLLIGLIITVAVNGFDFGKIPFFLFLPFVLIFPGWNIFKKDK